MEKHFNITTQQDQYLVFPIRAKQKKTKFFLIADGKQQLELNIPIGTKDVNNCSYDFLSYLPIHQYLGKEIILSSNLPEVYMDQIHMVDKPSKQRKNRPLLHFTPDYGWVNDPNGLVYQNGWYHLYFQYNPFDTEWDNMSWGHAISKDLLHWEQQDTVLFPDEDGTIFSGCGLVNHFGLLDLPENALLFFYSAAGNSNELSKGKTFVQKLAYSLDGGRTLRKKQIVLPTICKENRDPKIFWHQESNAYIMCLWMENNEFAIFRSKDLEHWNISQRFTLEKGFECPDLFQLSVEQNEEISKWIFWCADGFYYIGTFDGYKFCTNGIRNEAYCTKIPYAAQTISNTEDRTISISWLRTKTVDCQYTGAMGLPREIALINHNGKLKLSQRLVKEVLETQKLVFKNYSETNQKITKLDWVSHQALKINLRMENNTHTNPIAIHGQLLGFQIMYDSQSGVLRVENEEITIKEDITDLCILIDQRIVEVTANEDTLFAVFEVEKEESIEIALKTNGIQQLEFFQIS